MSTITIDDVEYASESLSDAAKIELGSLQVCDQRIETLETDLAIAKTARNAYAYELNRLLPKRAEAKDKPKPKPKPKPKKA